MPRNGSGTYTLPQPSFVSNTVISSSAMNSDLSDIASALTASIANDGQTTLSSAIKNPNGSAGTPGVSFAGDATTGIYLSSAGTLGLTAGGTSVGTSTSSTTAWALNTTIAGTLGVTGAATLSSTLAVTGNSTFTGTISDPRGTYTGVLLNTLTASNSGTLSDTSSLTSNYSYYDIVCEQLIPATGSTTLELQVHASSAFQTSGYLGATLSVVSGTTGVANATTFIQLSRANTVQTGSGISGTIRVFTPSSGSFVHWRGNFIHADGTLFCAVDTSGAWNTAAVVDGFQILFSSGNITSGKVKIVGYI